MSENSQNFDARLFHCWLTGWKEGPRFDFKQEVIPLINKQGRPDESKKFEFLTREEEKILTHISHRKETPTTAQVLNFLNQLRAANNRNPITLSTGD